VIGAIAGTVLLSGIGLLLSSWTSHPKQLEEHAWQQLQPNAIASAVAQGQVVFVDVTADWCVTCKANKNRCVVTRTRSECFALG